jgi:hypothetical protein
MVLEEVEIWGHEQTRSIGVSHATHWWTEISYAHFYAFDQRMKIKNRFPLFPGI